MPVKIVALGLAIALTVCLPARGHHGGAVEWQQGVAGPITGIATEFAFRFPHVFLSLDVGGDGEARSWSMVTRWTPTILRRHGWSRDSIKPGDTVTVTYLPHVSDPTVGHIQTIEVNGNELQLQFWPNDEHAAQSRSGSGDRPVQLARVGGIRIQKPGP